MDTVLYMETNIHFWPYLTQFFLEWEMFERDFVQKIKTLFTFSNCFSIVPFMT
jgi:hypothetical protein